MTKLEKFEKYCEFSDLSYAKEERWDFRNNISLGILAIIMIALSLYIVVDSILKLEFENYILLFVAKIYILLVFGIFSGVIFTRILASVKQYTESNMFYLLRHMSKNEREEAIKINVEAIFCLEEMGLANERYYCEALRIQPYLINLFNPNKITDSMVIIAYNSNPNVRVLNLSQECFNNLSETTKHLLLTR